MIVSLLRRLAGRHHRKFLAKAKPIVAQINRIEVEYQALSDQALSSKTQEFIQRHNDGESLDQLLPEAFAVVKNTARRLCGREISVCGQKLTWDMVPYDVQLIGGIALHQNTIAEMATGEGKTLVSTLPLYLNALTGRNCQLVTVNDYLARRDAEWMGGLYQFLGLNVGVIQNQMPAAQRRAAYSCNITYGTAAEFGFDYLRDNGMATSQDDQVQSDHYYVIVDEIDSILIDEARTPLIISGPMQDDGSGERFLQHKPGIQRLVGLQTQLCDRLAEEATRELQSEQGDSRVASAKLLQLRLGFPKHKQLLSILENGAYRRLLETFQVEMNNDFNKEKLYELKEALYYTLDEKQHQADLTEKGRNALRPNDPNAFVLPDLPSIFIDIDKRPDVSPALKQKAKQDAETNFSNVSEDIHCISQLLRAYSLYERDVAYVIQDAKVMIVDEHTGRLMPGRRWSDGLHQAVEAKEGVTIERESKTYATITIQNYFRMYEKLAGMTGTAETEATEFYDIYRLSVVVIPTHRPCIRQDFNDVIYKTRREKYTCVIQEIEKAHKKGQPVLVGTISVEASEHLSRMLRKHNIPHTVLNAKFHQKEAEIIARAGQHAAVTIATNMAGRGTDIKLGDGVKDCGGLLVLGTERHESRRIDRQLRGRCARQGDPGASRFFVSIEDDLMRLFANTGPIASILQKTFQEGEQLEHPLLNRSIESAQKKVEQHNFSIRKRLLQYDDVLNKQREVVYGIRNEALHSKTPRDLAFEMIEEELTVRFEDILPDSRRSQAEPDPHQMESFLNWINTYFPVALKPEDVSDKKPDTELIPSILKRIREAYRIKEETEAPEALIRLERYAIIHAVDKHWQDHLTEMEDLRRSVGLRSYGQKDPLNEYKGEAYRLFQEMIGRTRNAICVSLFRFASNVDAFKNMMDRFSRSAQEVRATFARPDVTAMPPARAQGLPSGSGMRPSSASNDTRPAPHPSIPSTTPSRTPVKVGRNQPCPCGSSKKYKQCCGKRV